MMNTLAISVVDAITARFVLPNPAAILPEIEVGQLVACALIGFTGVLIHRSWRTRRPAISKPVIGFLDLSDGLYGAELARDRAMLGSLFHSVVEGTGGSPQCDVLFMYCDLETDGRIRGSSLGLREVIRNCGASIVVVASEHAPDQCGAAAAKKNYGHANLVITLDRKGEVFGSFFYKLFSAMKNGVSMPMAWVKLAPQIPGKVHPDCPDAIFCCELGQVAFAKDHGEAAIKT